MNEQNRAQLTARRRYAIDKEIEMMIFVGAEISQWTQSELTSIEELVAGFTPAEIAEYNEWVDIFRLAAANVDLNFARQQHQQIDPRWETNMRERIQTAQVELTRAIERRRSQSQ